MALGLLLAVLLDQRIRGENVLRTIFLYPLAVSFVVTGTVWSWLLNPALGVAETGARHRLERLSVSTGWSTATWRSTPSSSPACGRPQASPWRCSWPGCDRLIADLIKAAQIDGAGPWRMYLRVVLPTLWPIFIAVLVILLQFAIKTFDLVRALTGGGPGISTMLPSLVVYDFMFQRGQLGRGSAGGGADAVDRCWRCWRRTGCGSAGSSGGPPVHDTARPGDAA